MTFEKDKTHREPVLSITQVVTFTDSEDEIEAASEEKQSDLEFETGSGHAMDMFR